MPDRYSGTGARAIHWPASIALSIMVASIVSGQQDSAPVRSAATPQDAPRAVNIAHRGASAYAPEHTLAAYRRAIEMGADFVEQDLQLTRDGVLVCLHDPTLERTTDVETRFPDRAAVVDIGGTPRRVWRVADFDLSEIKQLDAGNWFDEQFAGERVPTFQEAIDLVVDHAGVGLYPETKLPDMYQAAGLAMEVAVVEVLHANGLDTQEAQATTPIFIQSFSPESLRRLRTLAGQTYGLIQLVDAQQADTMMNDAALADVAAYADGIGPSLTIVMADPDRIRAARTRGLEVHPYTVRERSLPDGFPDVTAYMHHLVTEVGATGVFTDHPDLFPRPARPE